MILFFTLSLFLSLLFLFVVPLTAVDFRESIDDHPQIPIWLSYLIFFIPLLLGFSYLVLGWIIWECFSLCWDFIMMNWEEDDDDEPIP